MVVVQDGAGGGGRMRETHTQGEGMIGVMVKDVIRPPAFYVALGNGIAMGGEAGSRELYAKRRVVEADSKRLYGDSWAHTSVGKGVIENGWGE
jgi:hypothetical protein